MTIVTIPPVFDTWLCIPDIKAKKRDTALQQMAAFATQAGAARDPDLLTATLLRRERSASSAVGKGVAIPHARSLGVTDARVLVARAPRGIDWGAPDGAEVHLMMLALAPAEMAEEAFYDLVARAAGLVRLQRPRQKLIDAEGAEALSCALRAALS